MARIDRAELLGRAKARLAALAHSTDTHSHDTADSERSKPPIGESDPNVHVLMSTPLFDVAWYAAASGCKADRGAAVRHYLKSGHQRGLSPHPLFDPGYFVAQLPANEKSAIPFVAYLARTDSADVSPSPLFGSRAYAQANPEAVHHPDGLLGHYMQLGARAGARANEWYIPEADGRPTDIADWVRARGAEWHRRNDAVPRLSRTLPRESEEFLRAWSADGTTAVPGADPVVTVLVIAGPEPALLDDTIAGVRAQTHTGVDLVLVHERGPDGLAAALNEALAGAAGTYVAWANAGEIWEPDHLSRLLWALRREGSAAGHAAVAIAGGAQPTARVRFAAQAATTERLAAGLRVHLGSLLVERSLALSIGGFDEALPTAADHDFLLRLASAGALTFVPAVGVRTVAGPADADSRHDRAHDAVLNRHLIDWAALASRPTEAGTVTVIIPTYQDWRLTTQAVRTVTATTAGSDLTVQIIVLDNGSGLETSVVLDSLPLRFPGVTVVHSPVNHGFALGNNLALAHAEGGVVVFLNNDTAVNDGWLEPLLDALADPDVLGAQSLLIYPAGTIQSAGYAFPSCGGVPHALLQHFPVEDAASLESARLAAGNGAALALRFADLGALRGFDPVFRNGMEDVDLGLRLSRMRPGRFTVRPASVVRHYEARSPGRYDHVTANHAALLDRWGDDMPGDDVALWRAAGYDVLHYDARAGGADADRLAVPAPVLARRPRASVVAGLPSLRWAIKTASLPGVIAEGWGDTHFARRLAAALRRLGQEVVIDFRLEFARRTGRFDDVVLTLRGREPYRPVYGQVNLVWLISHPEMFTRAEARSYDRVLASSVRWAESRTREWGVRIEPLLQATDPEQFHPDRAAPDTGHPILFVGGTRGEKRPLVVGAIEHGLPVTVYGHDWDGWIPAHHVAGTVIAPDRLGVAYRAAGVVLNDHWEDMRVEGFLSNRLFDAAAAGARLVTDDVAGLGDLFGRSVQVARDASDVERLTTAPDLDAIFGDDAERRAVAARVHAEHSFDARARRLLDIALAERDARSASRRAGART